MTARMSATRAEVMASAAEFWAGEDAAPRWCDSEHMRGFCDLIAVAFGTSDDDPDGRRDEVWLEINTALQAENERGRARAGGHMNVITADLRDEDDE